MKSQKTQIVERLKELKGNGNVKKVITGDAGRGQD
jgi:hypothetical protein